MKIFLDVDGVLANFRKGVHDHFKQPYDYATLSKKWLFWEDWDRITSKMVNSICTIGFWKNLEWMHDGKNILNIVEGKFSPKNIYLLTVPMPNVESATGKWLWVKENIPQYYKRTIITQLPKSLLAKPDTLLIDDRNKNAEEFIMAGGKAILIPRPWNREHQCTNYGLELLKIRLGDF